MSVPKTLLWCDLFSFLQEQKALIKPVMVLLKNYHIIFIGDREFHSIELATWLKNEKKKMKINLNWSKFKYTILFFIRIRNSIILLRN